MTVPRYECTCHCHGDMFYRHLHDPSCPLAIHGTEAPKSELTIMREERDTLAAKLADVEQERDELKRLTLTPNEYLSTIQELQQRLATLRAAATAILILCPECGIPELWETLFNQLRDALKEPK